MLVSKKDYAKHRGVSPERIYHLANTKRLVLRGDKVDLEKSDIKLGASIDVTKRGPKPVHKQTPSPVDDLLALPGDPGGSVPEQPDDDVGDGLNLNSTYTSAKIRKERFAAKMVEAQYRKMVGELVEVSAVSKAIADNMGPVVRALTGLGARIASRVAAEYQGDPRRCQTIIDNEIETVKEEIAETARALPGRLTETQQ